MSTSARKEYVEVIRHQYKKADKAKRSDLLNQVITTCGYNRKYAIRLLGAAPRAPSKRKSKRPRTYDAPELLKVLVHIWKASNLACGKRLVAMIPLWLPWYETSFHVTLPASIQQRLMTISAATIDQLLARNRKRNTKLGLATTKPGSILKNHIPIKGQQWDETHPGFLAIDTVAHCGGSMDDTFVFTIMSVDIATQWTEIRAVWSRRKVGVLNHIKDIKRSLPFPLRGLDCDNGGEFVNWHVHNYLTKRKRPIDFTRSRPYQKNDNAYVENKNWKHVRQYFDYERFENPALVDMMNDLYTTDLRLLVNFFLPSVKLTTRRRDGVKVIKTYDAPMTPYERVLVSPEVTAKEKMRLRTMMQNINPFEVQERVKTKILRILSSRRA